MKITTTTKFIERAVEAYNKIFTPTITRSEVESVIIDSTCIFVNSKIIDWECIKFD